MQLRLHQLTSHLSGKLAPVYVVSGDEPLQLREALDGIRAAARAAGFTERTAVHVDASFDWSLLQQFANNLSLFAEKRLLDLTIKVVGGKIGEAAARAILDYTAQAHPDRMLLMNTAKLEAKVKKSRWYCELQRIGITLEVWPIPSKSLPTWVKERANRLGLRLTDAAALFLAERGEGNLLAIVQELEKLHLLHGPAITDIDQVVSAVADSARFQPFDLVESTLLGDALRTVRILRGLREEDIAPQLVLGTLAWEVRALAQMSRRLEQGKRLEQLLNDEQRVWQSRRWALQQALERHRPAHWLDVMATAVAVDRAVKGLAPEDPWDALQRLSLLICGVRIFPYNTDQA